ncbi:hypothetical protein [Ligilactobacillus salivarius]|uniref:Membrane protein 6-pyruvoyl-tetrahydropterin synthase-related domain-containing protein n=1 Tax=Ligilactobacillus salivarius TaxID=1624 RepID=A0A1V9QYI6_9LACO|nr:hypothetical protein [Ligilactobacillus salivarius]OQQ82637.1 hypothetical protein B6U60_07605 [Ligilactobacillus salivarius]OQQ85731.1 hypothetical protein B6U59_07770 [Ligilactobacillus salivarius]
MKKYINDIKINITFIILSILYEITFILGNKPLAYYGKFNGDQLFHITRLSGLKDIFTSPINFSTYHGVGNGVNFFYPWLTFYPAEIFSEILHSKFKGMVVFLLLLTYLTFVLSYYPAKRYLKWNTKRSMIFSFLWTFSTYRGLNFFDRTDIGELLAAIYIPVLVMSFIDLIKNKNYNNWIIITISMSLVLFSHILSTLIVTFILILLLLINYTSIRDIRIWWSLLKAVIATSLLTVGFWMPMLQQMKYIPIRRPFVAILEDWAININDMIGNSMNSNYLLPNVGAIVIFIVFISLIKFKKLSIDEKKILIITLVLLWGCTKAFPWQIFQSTFINYIQFPWRLMMFASFFAYLLGAILLDEIDVKYVVSLFGVILISHYAFVIGLPKDQVTLLNNDKNIEKISKEYINADYYPKAITKDPIGVENKKFVISNKEAKVSNYKNTDTEFKFTVINESNKKVIVDVPILYYLGTEVKNNNKLIPVTISSRGTVQVELSNKNNNVVISSRYTKLARISQAISLGTALIIASMFFIKKQRNNRSKN